MSENLQCTINFNRILYWTVVGLWPKIVRGTIATSSMTTIVNQDIHQPNDVVYDKYSKNHLLVKAFNNIGRLCLHGGSKYPTMPHYIYKYNI